MICIESLFLVVVMEKLRNQCKSLVTDSSPVSNKKLLTGLLQDMSYTRIWYAATAFVGRNHHLDSNLNLLFATKNSVKQYKMENIHKKLSLRLKN